MSLLQRCTSSEPATMMYRERTAVQGSESDSTASKERTIQPEVHDLKSDSTASGERTIQSSIRVGVRWYRFGGAY